MKNVFLFLIGGALYILTELLYRGYSHISMFLVGGLCFLLIGSLNEYCFSWSMGLLGQMVTSSALITTIEFFTGMLLNVYLKLNIWDYSNEPYNLYGQICLLYTNIWFLLALPAILIDDLLRDKWFGEERKKYNII